ncbi:MAG: hypothetical protein J2P17_14605 [Mycobacterium sp.]|nr:hypothetical protein [Mycobacterium sp.]
MATPSTNYTQGGEDFTIPADETESTDPTQFIIKPLKALDHHDHSLGRGAPIVLGAGVILTNPTINSPTITSPLVVSGGFTVNGGGATITGNLTVNGTISMIGSALSVSDSTNGVVRASTGSLYLRSSGATNAVYMDTGSGGLQVTAGPLVATADIDFGTTNQGSNYVVPASISQVFCTSGITVTLPAASTTKRRITVTAVAGTSTINAAGGSVFGGSFNTTTGAVMNGTLVAPDSIDYKSDGTNWRAS